ncbi:MAG: LysR family transcriptional regulator [Deltaproteobacteria bacterium]|nr:LysR family transcriptional regulator [Deltaproteobacteria bacterium]
MSSIDFDLRQMEIFCKVVELKNFSKAAEAVFLAQASVSERISNLEKMVGVKLLDRLGKEVVPTRAGALFYKNAVRMLDMKRTAVLELENFMGVMHGEIDIGGSTIPGEYILPGLLAGFRRLYPEISVNLIVANTAEIRDRLMAGSLEIGIVGSIELHNKNLVHKELWQDELVLAVLEKHRWTRSGEITLEELSKEPFISRSPGSGTQRTLEDYLKRFLPDGIESLNVVASLGTSTAVKEGIKSGLGVSILSSKAVDTELRTGMLKIVKVKALPGLKRHFFLINDRRRTVSPLCQALMNFLSERKCF